MTAPARPVTREQLLVLADRAERGPLTAAEASRLRAGIGAMPPERRPTARGAGKEITRREWAISRRLVAVQALVQNARQRGTRVISVQLLDIALRGETDARISTRKLPAS